MRARVGKALSDWVADALDPAVPAGRRALCASVIVAAAALLATRPALANIIDDAVRDGTQGMLDYVVGRVNSMSAATIPTSFSNLFDGGAASSHICAKAVEYYGQGVARSIASTLLGLVMLVRLARISERAEAHATFPAVREMVFLLVSCAIYTYLVGHAWDLVAGAFADLSHLWSSWDADVPATVGRAAVGDGEGLSKLLPLFVSTAACMLLCDVSVVISKVVVWGRGMQLYFLATMSPIPLALLGMEETRQMGVGFLRNFCSLVLGYAALSFVVKLYPTLLATAVATSRQMGGTSDMVLSIMAASLLHVALTVRCGSWARDVLGG